MESKAEVPALVQWTIDQIDGGPWRANLGMTWNDDAAALDGLTHGHAEPRMDHRGAMFEVACGAHHGGLCIGTQLCRIAASRQPILL